MESAGLVAVESLAAPTNINDLGPQCLQHVFSQLPARELCRLAAVQQGWRQAVKDEQLWAALLQQDWDQEPCVGPPGGISSQGARKKSSWEAYCAWEREFGTPQYRPVIKRAVRAWRQAKAWLGQHAPEALESLLSGADEELLNEVEAELGAPLPAALRALYRIHNGQALIFDAQVDTRHEVPGAEGVLKAMIKRNRRTRGRAAPTAAAPAGPFQGRSALTAQGQESTATPPVPGGSQGQEQATGGGEEDEGMEGQQGGPHPSLFHGLFGGYSFYDHLAVTRLLPLGRAVWWTKHFRDRGMLRRSRPCFIFAASYDFKKLFACDVGPPPAAPGSASDTTPSSSGASGEQQQQEAQQQPSEGPQTRSRAGAGKSSTGSGGAGADEQQEYRGGVYVNQATGKWVDAVPHHLQATGHGVLAWFEEYAQRLASGWYEVTALDSDFPMSRAICLFPLKKEGGMEEAVTRGVRVRATTLYAPEASRSNSLVFTYSIRFSLLPEERQAEHWPATAGAFYPLTSCQLISRHWIIRDAAGRQTDEVHGEGVIGQYPILRPGEPEFVYQSCTNQKGTRGTMEGDFKFVEGTIRSRTGPEWNVECPRFTLAVPEYIY